MAPPGHFSQGGQKGLVKIMGNDTENGPTSLSDTTGVQYNVRQ